MRPVFGTPVLAPATIAPAAPCPAGQDCSSAVQSAPTISPGFPDSGSTITLPEAPSPPIAPAAPLDEPGLNPSSLPGSSESPPLDSPSTSSRKGVARPIGRTALRSRVEPFVNDPNDLFLPPKADRNWRYVVLHHSASDTGGYAQIDREHRKKLGTAGCGYHFVIGNGTGSPDGQVEVTQRWSDQKAGAHCRTAKDPGVNDYGIGICLVGDLDHNPPTAKQIAAAHALVAYLSERYAIPAQHVGTHAVVAQDATACPGKHFPAEAILGRRNMARNLTSTSGQTMLWRTASH